MSTFIPNAQVGSGGSSSSGPEVATKIDTPQLLNESSVETCTECGIQKSEQENEGLCNKCMGGDIVRGLNITPMNLSKLFEFS